MTVGMRCGPDRETYLELNIHRCAFSDAEWERILNDIPADGIPIVTRNELELALYRMPNGSHFATLKDDSDATWEAYCALLGGKGFGFTEPS